MSDDENTPKKKRLNRRSFMASVLGGAAVAGGGRAPIPRGAPGPQRATRPTRSDTRPHPRPGRSL